MGTPVLLIVMCHCIGCVLRCWLVRPSPLRKPLALSWLCFSSSWAHQLPRMPDMREIELVANTHLLNQVNTHATIRYTHSARASDVGHGSASKGPQTSTSSSHSRKCTAWAHNPNGGWGLEPIGPDVNQLHMGGFRSSSAEGTTTGLCVYTERWRTTAHDDVSRHMRTKYQLRMLEEDSLKERTRQSRILFFFRTTPTTLTTFDYNFPVYEAQPTLRF